MLLLPFGEEPLLFNLPLSLRLLQLALAFKIQLPLHRQVAGLLGLLRLPLLGLPIDRHVAGHAADGATDEHSGRAAAEDGAAGAGSEGGTAHRSDAGAATTAFAGGSTQGDHRNEENVPVRRR